MNASWLLPGVRSYLTKVLRCDIQGTIEYAGHVLECDQPGKFNDPCLVKMFPQGCKLPIRDLAIQACYRFRILQDRTFHRIEQCAFPPLRKLHDFFH